MRPAAATGRFGHRYKFAVVQGDVSCHRAGRVLRGYARSPAGTRLPGSWSCDGPGDPLWVCVDKAGDAILAWCCGTDRKEATKEWKRYIAAGLRE
jgi:hypothetical protein